MFLITKIILNSNLFAFGRFSVTKIHHYTMALNETKMYAFVYFFFKQTRSSNNQSIYFSFHFYFRLFDIISEFGLIANVLVLLCIVKSPKLKSVTYKLLGNVNIADLLSNLQLISLTILFQIYDFGMWFHSIQFIFITNMIYETLEISSIYMLVAISFHRFIGFTSTR